MEFFEIEKLVVGEKILSFTKVQKRDTFCPLCVVLHLQKILIMRTEGRDTKSRDRGYRDCVNFPPTLCLFRCATYSSFLNSFEEDIENTELI